MNYGEWDNRNILITGINGFIGSSVAKAVKEYGANVFGIVQEVNNIREDLNGCTILRGNICDYDFVRNVISAYEIDTIFHFAAYAIVRISARDPKTAYEVNIMGTVNILEAARSIGTCKAIVVASSDKAYGDHKKLPYTESFALQPKNTYDTSKACMDMVSRTYAHNYNMPVVVTRCSNVYGPGDLNLSRIIPNSIRRVLNGLPPQIYEDVSSMEREFIYIDDVVRAYLLLTEEILSGGTLYKDKKYNEKVPVSGEAFNIGGGGPTKIYDLVRLISKLSGFKELPTVIERESSFKEIKKQYIDASKLQKITGWRERVTLEQGIEKTIEWYRKYLKCV